MPLPIPTRLNNSQIREFQRLYNEHFDIMLSDEEAMEQGARLMQFVSFVIHNHKAFQDAE